MTNFASGSFPEAFGGVEALEDYMTAPDDALVADLATIDGDIIVLGVGGKMGPTLARMAKRAAPDKNVIGVARFSEAGLEEKLNGWDIETITCDLLDRDDVSALPECANVVFMAGRKFGSSGSPDLTWAMNVHVPAIVAEAYRNSRIVAFSSGNVYPMTHVDGPYATEQTVPGAIGEYAQSCLGRERMFEFFSGKYGTPGRTIRLNYAIDMRYGVLWDIGIKVFSGDTINLTAGHANVIWQGEANSRILRCLRHCTSPASPLNISGPALAVRDVATAFGKLFGKLPIFGGTEDKRGWLVDASYSDELLGPLKVPVDVMTGWLADWIAHGRENLNKPTAFDSRDGSF
jgi:nucleoside-diphosphate-sugar epimerase